MRWSEVGWDARKPLRPSAGRAMAVIQGLKGGGQLERQAVTRGEAVGGKFGPPADRGVSEAQSTAASPGNEHSPDHPLTDPEERARRRQLIWTSM